MSPIPKSEESEEMEEGKGKSNHLETEGGGATHAAADPSAADIAEEKKNRKKMKKLEKSIQRLALNDNSRDNSAKEEQLLKLEANRNQQADGERIARKAKGIEESRKEVLSRQEFRNSNIADLFPRLVWERILTNLGDPKEMARLSNLCLGWRDALKNERTEFLFHAVFPFLHTGVHLNRNDILISRTVSKEWNKSIDNYLQNRFDFEPASLLQKKKIRHHVDAFIEDMDIRFRVEALPVENFMKFRNTNPPSNGNPFFSRKMRLGCVCPHDGDMNYLFWSAMRRLLAQWGRELYLLAIRFSRIHNCNSLGVYHLVQSYLKFVPNLRQFNILGHHQMDNMDELKKAMEEEPLPDMPHLHTVNLQFIPLRMLNLMLNKYRTTLKTVMITTEQINMAAIGDIKFPKLKYFYASIHGKNCFSIPEPKLNFNWPSIVEINFQCENIDINAIPKLFQSLGQVSGTLRKLSLTFQKPGKPSSLGSSVIKTLSLDLPHLEDFSLSMDMGRANLKAIDFILPMTSLKKLNLCYMKSTLITIDSKVKPQKSKGRQSNTADKNGGSGGSASSREIIQFWSCTKRMYDSNIWKLFPELRKLTITTISIDMIPENIPMSVTDLRGTVYEGFISTDQFKVVNYTREGFNQHSKDSLNN